MFHLMLKYYDNVYRDEFEKDLRQKNAVILLRDSLINQIQGFSTLLHLNVTYRGRIHRGIFSGDTVLEREYWGSRALGKAFLKYFLAQKLKNPFSRLYWLLITKGYKTYLLMANNFSEYYPHFRRKTPAYQQELLDAFYQKMYGDHYFSQSGLIQFSQDSCRLKEGVAAPTDELVAGNRRVAFFLEKNPHWKSGVELACMAEMTYGMPIYYAGKSLFRIRWIKLQVMQYLVQKIGLSSKHYVEAKEPERDLSCKKQY